MATKTIHVTNRPLVERVNRFAAAERRSTTAQAEVLLAEAMDTRDRRAEESRLAAVEAGEKTDDEG